MSAAGSASRCDAAGCGASQPLKPAKKHRPDAGGDKQVARCKRRLDFVDGGPAERCRVQGRAVGGGGARRAASVARRNERERRRVSLINRTFETLRDQLPTALWGRRALAKVSKVETLRAAIGYIRTLEDLLATDRDVDDDAGVVEMLNSAERLASLTGGDAACPSPRLHGPTTAAAVYSGHLPATTQVDIHGAERLASLAGSSDAACSSPGLHGPTAASACPEHLQTTTYVDMHGATRRLSRLTSQQHPLYDVTAACSIPIEPPPDDRTCKICSFSVA